MTKSLPSIWQLLHNVKSTVKIFVNLCGLLRKLELYIIEFWYNIHNIRNVTYLKIIIRIKIKIASIYAIEQSSNFWNPTLYNLIAVNSSMYIQFKCAYSSTLFTVEAKPIWSCTILWFYEILQVTYLFSEFVIRLKNLKSMSIGRPVYWTLLFTRIE